MPFFGKSGTSRMSFLSPSQFTPADILVFENYRLRDRHLHSNIKLLEPRKNSVRRPAEPRIPLRHPREQLAALPAVSTAMLPTPPARRSPALRRCHRHCCAPSP